MLKLTKHKGQSKMPYVNTQKMLIQAKAKGFAVGAFNFSNMETLQAIVEANEKLGAPVIVQASESAIEYAGVDMLYSMVKTLAKKSKIDIALHLDHGSSFEICKKAIDAGFSSVMIDGSHLSFEENVKITKQVADYAHSKNVTVEGELGQIVGIEDAINRKDNVFTDPKSAQEFVKRTGVDSLAISIGTAHGVNKGSTSPRIRFDIIEAVGKITKIPLVVHGASTVPKAFIKTISKFGGKIDKAQGIDEKTIKQLSKTAVCKINMDTDIRLCFTASVRKFLSENPTVFDPRKILGNAKKATAEYVTYVVKNLLN